MEIKWNRKQYSIFLKLTEKEEKMEEQKKQKARITVDLNQIM